MFSWTIGLPYILSFMAGANTTGDFVAIIVVDSMSSAIPFATFPIMFAVAGTTSIRSAFFANEMWPISHSFGDANISVVTGFSERVCMVSGVMNLVAFSVIMT